MPEELPEVTRLYDARTVRPHNAIGVGEFWYEPELWSLPLSPASRVLYTAVCAFLGHGEINRKDLRNALRSSTDAEIARTFEDLVRHNLLAHKPSPKENPASYAVHSVKAFAG